MRGKQREFELLQSQWSDFFYLKLFFRIDSKNDIE